VTFKAEIVGRFGWEWNSGAVDDSQLNYTELFTHGPEANQAEAVWHLEDVTLLDAVSVTYDLTALTRDVFGDTLITTLLLVKSILVVNKSTAGGKLLLGGAAANEWSECFGGDGDSAEVPLDSPLLLSNRKCGWEVDDTHKNLKVAAVGGDVTYSIVIIGTTTTAVGDCSSSGL
jgi:hypothetical protein